MLVSGVLRSDESEPGSPHRGGGGGGALLSPGGASPRGASAWDAIALAAAVSAGASTPAAVASLTSSGGRSPLAAALLYGGGGGELRSAYTPEGARLDALRDDVESLEAALRDESDAALWDGVSHA